LRDGGALGIGLLPGREFAELGVALQIEIGVGKVRLVLRLLGLGLIQRRLEGARIDLDQGVALLDELAPLKSTFRICPSTRVRTWTVLNPCTVPRPVR
jgi:hypothetical protein